MGNTMNSTIQPYSDAQNETDKAICNKLKHIIDTNLPEATSKIWHGAPVWFIDGNPIVGYWVRKHDVRLLFWSGQSFDELSLLPEGTFKAAETRYNNVKQIDETAVKRWLEKAKTIQWDYKNLVRRRGILERLK